MVIEKVEGIVIRDLDYSDSSKIITVLTKEHQAIGIMAKGARQIKSKLRTSIMPFTYGFFHVYYKPDKLSTLIAVDVVDYMKTIRTDIKAYSYAIYMTDILNQVIKEEYPPQIYHLYTSAILKINEGFNPKIITSIYEIQMLNHLGIAPVLDECASCGNQDIVTFSIEAGGNICSNCITDERIVNPGVLKLISMLAYVDISKISKLDINNERINELSCIIDDYFEKYSGLYLKSKKTIAALTELD